MLASERRKKILEILCVRRFETRENLAFEFDVSTRTIDRDISFLSCEYPIYTTQGNGGGIHVDKDYKLGKVYLKDEQQKLLERLLENLQGKDAEVMRSILSTFGLTGVSK